MTFTTIYLVGAALGAARGLLELDEVMDSINAAADEAVTKFKETAGKENITDEATRFLHTAVKGIICTTVVTTSAVAWPLVMARDIYSDIRVAFA